MSSVTVMCFSSGLIQTLLSPREQRPAALLHREGGEGDLAAAEPHLLQPPRPSALPVLRPAGGKTQPGHRGDGRLWSGVRGGRGASAVVPHTCFSQSLWSSGTLFVVPLFARGGRVSQSMECAWSLWGGCVVWEGVVATGILLLRFALLQVRCRPLPCIHRWFGRKRDDECSCNNSSGKGTGET